MQWRLCRVGDRWGVRYKGSRYRLPVPYGPTTEAQARAKAVLACQQHDDQHGTTATTCAEIFDAYITDARARENAITDPSNLIYARKAVLAHYGALRPDQCTREQCRAYLAAGRAAGRADSTMRTQLSYLRAALRWHDRNTPAVFEMPRETPTRDQWLTVDQLAALRDAAQSQHVALFITIASCTAARSEAILGLTWGTHVDLDAGEIWLGFKAGGKGRATLPINATLREALLEARALAITPYVIEFNGKPVRSIRKGLTAAYARAGIDVRQPAHILRKTAGRLLIESGVSMEVVSQIMGHSSIKITERIYARFSPDGMRAAIEEIRI